MKTEIENSNGINHSAGNFAQAILAKIRERHRLTSTVGTAVSTLSISMTPDQINEETYRQLEVEEKKNQARIYSGLSYLK
jgi:hypothetical protein